MELALVDTRTIWFCAVAVDTAVDKRINTNKGNNIFRMGRPFLDLDLEPLKT
jgi:hypothetical protein